MIDCEAVEHVEFDNEGAAGLYSRDIIVARNCACNYTLHRTCWERWRKQRPMRHRGLRCLVCSSPVERRRSRGEIIAEFFETHEVQSAILCKYIVYVVVFMILFLVMYEPYG
jgi:hypothetical protein